MAFKVRFTDKLNDYDTGDTYDFLEGGVLSIAYAANKAIRTTPLSRLPHSVEALSVMVITFRTP